MLNMKPTYHRLHRLLALPLGAAAALVLAGSARGAELVVSGAGDGHGVGMSQEGAYGYAQHGLGYQAILAHYYAGTALGQAPAGAQVRVMISGRVHRVALETYVRGVVSAEMPATWPAAALEAQAVASRTYALTAHAGGAAFDVYADTRSQVYRGVVAQTPQTDAAVAATAGQIVTYEGRPAITYFFASSGGRTENVENSFPGSAAAPWLQGVLDPYDQGPLHSWKLGLSFAAAASRLHGLVRGSFRGIEVLRRGFSPRIVSAYVLGSRGRTLVAGAQLAARLRLYGSWAYFSVRRGEAVTPEPDLSAQPTAPSAPEGAATSPATAGAGQGGVQAGAPPAPVPAPAPSGSGGAIASG